MKNYELFLIFKVSCFVVVLFIITLYRIRVDSIRKECIKHELDFLLKSVKINIDVENGYRIATDQLSKIAEANCKDLNNIGF